ncbi:MAG TPA: AI-2E family transporter [Steroidobacteraceae bacterium]|nr:AI-2E family transporter [Steroidobacteraceae bacterium]
MTRRLGRADPDETTQFTVAAEHSGEGSLTGFSTRVAIVLVLIAVAAVVWKLAGLLILAFAGALLAILLRSMTSLLSRGLHLPWKVAFAVVLTAVLGAIVAAGWFGGRHVVDELNQLSERLPQAWNRVQEWLLGLPGGRSAVEELRYLLEQFTTFPGLGGVAWGFVGAVGSVVLIGFVAVFLAASPRPYISGVLEVIPPAGRERVALGLNAAAHSLRWWLVGQLISMVAVAVLTVIGLWLLDVPLALTLGLIAGVLEFIPFIGPLLSAVPAILTGFSVDPQTALYVAALYFVIQQVEGNLIVPLAQRWAVALPPAFGLLAGTAFALLFGIPGLFFAVPMLVALRAIVRKTYVEPMNARAP